ncbi:hypothetical protein ACGC1H_002339 [Rhizoctonia solani]
MPPYAPPDDLFHNIRDLTSTTKILGTKPFAHGGASDIWRGFEWSTRTQTREVAIKIIRVVTRQTVSLERLKKRIARELMAWSAVDHQNILPFLGLCWFDGRNELPAMVYPYCEAGTCSEYLINNMDADRMAIIRQVADGLNHLHSYNPPIAHGDIKAANILMKQDGTPLIADFGLSRLVSEFSTGLTTSLSRGSYRWMAPELFGGIDSSVLVLVTPASDVWAFGCLCLEILSGVIPWASTRNDAAVMLDVVKNRKVPPLPESIETTPIGHIMRHCWAYEPLERPSIAQLVNALVEIDPELLHTHTCILPQPSVSSDSPTFSEGSTANTPQTLYMTPNHRVTKARYVNSSDPRGYVPVYEYPLNGQWIMMDTDDGYVLWTGIWKVLGSPNVEIVKILESQPDLAGKLRRVRGGYLKMQGTWMARDVAFELARRVAWKIRYDLVPLFGPSFPDSCLSPDQPGYGKIVTRLPAKTRRSKRGGQSSPPSTSTQLPFSWDDPFNPINSKSNSSPAPHVINVFESPVESNVSPVPEPIIDPYMTWDTPGMYGTRGAPEQRGQQYSPSSGQLAYSNQDWWSSPASIKQESSQEQYGYSGNPTAVGSQHASIRTLDTPQQSSSSSNLSRTSYDTGNNALIPEEWHKGDTNSPAKPYVYSDYVNSTLAFSPLKETSQARYLARGSAADVWVVQVENKQYVCKVLRVSATNFEDEPNKIEGNRSDQDSGKEPSWRSFVQAYRSQISKWSVVRHTNLIRICDHDESLNLHVEYCHYGSVRDYLKVRHTGMAPKREIICGVLHGLRYLHSQNPPIIHGSLNAGKVFVDDNHQVKIGEFGLTVLCYHIAPQVPSIAFTGFSRWMSPELLDLNPDGDVSVEATVDSDIWALACTIYEIVAEELPYSKYSHDIRIQRAILKGEFPGDLASWLSKDQGLNLDTDWELLLKSCWSMHASKRPNISDLISSYECS